MQWENIECLVIGGGPAGLTAALYLARFRRNVLLCDAGASRAELIPNSFNYPGFLEGISGKDLLSRLRTQAEQFGAIIQHTKIERLSHNADSFIANTNDKNFKALRVIIATGIIDKKPSFPSMKEFIYEGSMRFCPICDGYEAMNKSIAVIGPFSQASTKALFLRTFSNNITIFCEDTDFDVAEAKRKISHMNIDIAQSPVADLKLQDNKVLVIMKDKKEQTFDLIYPAMGCNVQSDLAKNLGAKINQAGFLMTDYHQQTSIPGLYAAGDVVLDLSQISVATGQAAIAATAAHNSLNESGYRKLR